MRKWAEGICQKPEWSQSLLSWSLEGWGPPDSSRRQFTFHDLQLLLALCWLNLFSAMFKNNRNDLGIKVCRREEE